MSKAERGAPSLKAWLCCEAGTALACSILAYSSSQRATEGILPIISYVSRSKVQLLGASSGNKQRRACHAVTKIALCRVLKFGGARLTGPPGRRSITPMGGNTRRCEEILAV